MMEYSKLKVAIQEKAFDLIANMIDDPTCDLCLPNYTSIVNPFDSSQPDVTSISQDEYIHIDSLKCIYTYNKLFVQENDVNLGSEYSLMVYVKYDEVSEEILNNVSSLVVYFDKVYYPVKKPMNLYKIL
jgi:hypothetical protein